MKTIKSWREHTEERGIGSCEARDEEIAELRAELARLQAQGSIITEHAAYQVGATGAQPCDYERLLFEAWMRGHCWAVVGTWDGRTYVHACESTEGLHPGAMSTRRLWAAWRDRAALSYAASGADAGPCQGAPLPSIR